MAGKDFLGITVLGDFILSEGVEPIIENLQRVGASAVTVNPTVTAPGDENNGSFQPPIDAGSSPRVFDRPLWGKHSLWVRSGVSYHPNADLYQDSGYSPRQPNDLTDEHGAIIGQFIDRAVDVGLKVYLQLGAVQPSGLRDEDKPRLPDGTIPPNRMANTASLASDAVRSYNAAYVRDLVQQYPTISGFRPDWPEYPCYTLGEVFQDFSDHVREWALDRGFDFDAIKADVGQFYDLLLGRCPDRKLSNADFERGWKVPDDLTGGLSEWLLLKSALSVDLLQHWRDIIDDAAGENCELSANAFMPQYTQATGFSFPGAAEICHAVSPKLYTMHWSLMVKFWAEPMLVGNPQLSEEAVVRCLVRLMDIADDSPGLTIAEYGYPAPDEPHPVPDGPQLRKLADVAEQVGENCDVTALVHGYGPLDDFTRRLQLVADCGAINGLWINRYGYLSDAKLDAVADAFAQ
ncbi:MAG: hypothetical protein ACYTGL_21020 [Planctomycetota bacterium]|jgi:hypothetical protein